MRWPTDLSYVAAPNRPSIIIIIVCMCVYVCVHYARLGIVDFSLEWNTISGYRCRQSYSS